MFIHARQSSSEIQLGGGEGFGVARHTCASRGTLSKRPVRPDTPNRMCTNSI